MRALYGSGSGFDRGLHAHPRRYIVLRALHGIPDGLRVHDFSPLLFIREALNWSQRKLRRIETGNIPTSSAASTTPDPECSFWSVIRSNIGRPGMPLTSG